MWVMKESELISFTISLKVSVPKLTGFIHSTYKIQDKNTNLELEKLEKHSTK